MNQCCFICNNKTGLSLRNATTIFGEHNILTSGKKLSEVLGNIVDKTLEKNNIHTSVLCKKCFKACSEYDLTETRLRKLKNELVDQFKESLTNLKLDFDNYEKNVSEKIATSQSSEPLKKQPIILGKKVVVPASKLHPVPPSLLLKVGNLTALTKNNVITPQLKPTTSSTLNLKVTVGNSVLTQTIVTSHPSKPADTPTTNILTLSDSIKQEIENLVTSQAKNNHKTSNLNFNVNTLPKNFLSDAVLAKISDDVNAETNNAATADQSMGIDEECSVAMVPVSSATHVPSVKTVDGAETNVKVSPEENVYLNVDELQTIEGANDDHKYILSKLEILDGDDDGDDEEEGHTIVLDGENGSILRMVSGQKLIYNGNEISLVMAEEDQQDDDNNDINDDDHDSNDEASIELQMAGDEETAQAILAAAQEQGGAFIKVESGEMFRVQRRQEPSAFVEKLGDRFKCLLCEKNPSKNNEAPSGPVLGDAAEMMSHLKEWHDARLYICQLCSLVMRKRMDYNKHVAKHGSKQKGAVAGVKAGHSCPTCGKNFTSRVLLEEHCNVHAGLRPYRCNVCLKSFASKYTHQSHLKTHVNRPRPFRCSMCTKSFLTQQNLVQHERTHSGVKDFICNICHKAFSTQHNLEVHGVVHSGNKAFVCNICEKAFARRAELRDHVRTHTGERPFECEVCGARFTQRSNLHSHRRATHLDDKRHHCAQCNKKFKRRRLLEYHIKATHTGERPLKCTMCPSSFVYPEHYKKHIRIHSGERPFLCEICGKSFSSRDNRNTHRFTHSEKKPYECVTCGAGFMRKQLLYAHMTTSGHLAESIVVNHPRIIDVPENAQVAESVLGSQSRVVELEQQESNLTPTDERTESQLNDKLHTLFEVASSDDTGKSIVIKQEELEQFKLMCNIISDDKKLVLQPPEKESLGLIQEQEEPTLLTIHNLEDRSQSILEAVTAEQLDEENEIVARDEEGREVRLVRVRLPAGQCGWVATL